MISGTVFQSVANYTCDNGYNLVGIQSRTCENNAMWSGTEPECKGMIMDNTFAASQYIVCF